MNNCRTYYEVIDGKPSLWDNPGPGRVELEVRYDSQGSYITLLSEEPLPPSARTPHFKFVDGQPTFFDEPIEETPTTFPTFPMTLIDAGWVWEHPDCLHLLKPQTA